MALITCAECGKDVSTQAKTCPSCGAKVKLPKAPMTTRKKYFLYALGGAMAIPFFVGMAKNDTPEAKAAAAESRDIGMAEVTCKTQFEKNANDPSSVDWLRPERSFLYTSADKVSALSLQPVRAKNKMGALVLATVKCTLIKKDGQWQVDTLAQLR